MAQQAKDIYSGIKKIFPSSRRSSGSFSFSGRSSSSASAAPNLFGPDGEELSAAAIAAAAAADADKHKKERKKKERRPSFSFSSWGKDKHRSSSSASGSGSISGPSTGGLKPDTDQVVMSLPYGAQAATPKGYLSPSQLTEYQNQNQNPNNTNNTNSSSCYYNSAPARGSLYNEPSAAVTSASSKATGHRSSLLSGDAPSSTQKPHAFSSTSLEPPKLGGRSVSVDLTSCSGRNSTSRLDDRVMAANPSLLHYSGPSSSSGTRASRRSRNSSASNISTSSVGPLSSTRAPTSNPSSVRSFSSSVSDLAAPTVLEHEPLHAPVKRRDSLSVYRHSMSAASLGSSLPSGGGRASLGSLSLGQVPPPPASSVLTPEKPKKKKERRTSLSFTSSRKKQAEAATATSISTISTSAKPMPVRRTSSGRVVDDLAAVVKPHTLTWDSDSDDDYEDTKRPTRGLDRRSQSMDFMEQAPTHLISKIWRKLPIQARLIGGRGSIDLDLQKDRNSFSRSSSAKQQLREQQQVDDSPSRRPPSPVPDESNVFGDKRIRFSHTLRYFPDREERDGYTALESYDDVLVRVCRFAAHDKRRTATKVQEFLERSMAFLHGTRTKHGNVVSISNEEIRMWRRLALHDWALEEVTRSPSGAETKAGKKDKRSSSSVSTAGSDDSDESSASRPRPPAIETMSEEEEREPAQENEEEDDDEEEEELKLPRRLNLSPLREAVNYCVGFGERLFSTDEIDDLVRLEFLVEEDGWI